MLEGFLLGVVATASMTASLYFLKFWRKTRDSFFLAFAVSFLIEGLNRIGVLLIDKPSEGSPWSYTIRLFAFLLILAAIIKKNSGARR
jgi:hypothetical protein